MSKAIFLLLALVICGLLQAQSKHERIIQDNKKKFYYSDTMGVTQSYISYFGDTFTVPTLVTIDGNTIDQAALTNKTVVYNFWFVSCRPCVAEIPALNKLADKYRSDSVLFIAVTFDQEPGIKEFLQQRKFDFQIASLPQTEIDKIKKVSFYPFTAIVSKEGKLSFAIFGKPTGKNPGQEIFDLLDKQLAKALQ